MPAPCVPGILATLSFLDMQGCPFLLCNFFQKGLAKNIKRQGFRSLNNFATKAGIVTSNLYTNLRGDFRISLESAFQIANTLGVPIIDVLEIFCKEDMTKNRETVRSHNVSSACANDTSTDGVIDPLLWR